jgi:hypothetical protein
MCQSWPFFGFVRDRGSPFGIMTQISNNSPMKGIPGLAIKGFLPARHAQPYQRSNAAIGLRSPAINSTGAANNVHTKPVAKVGSVNQKRIFGKIP